MTCALACVIFLCRKRGKVKKNAFFFIFLRKNLVNSKKSSTFAPAFGQEHGCSRKMNAFCAYGRREHLIFILELKVAEIAQLVEHNLAKVGVASSSLVFRSFFLPLGKRFAPLLGPPTQLAKVEVGRAEAQVARQFSGAVLTFATLLPNAKPRWRNW